MAVSTATTDALYDAIKIRLLTFDPPGAQATLAAQLSGGLSFVAPPDSAPTPYGAIRLADIRHRRSQRGRITAELELMLIHRPRAKSRELERLADIADQAMHDWTDATNGMIACTAYRRQTLPPFKESDPELVQIRCLYDLVIYPAYLTQYLAP
jgi:hypothetical protein